MPFSTIYKIVPDECYEIKDAVWFDVIRALQFQGVLQWLQVQLSTLLKYHKEGHAIRMNIPIAPHNTTAISASMLWWCPFDSFESSFSCVSQVMRYILIYSNKNLNISSNFYWSIKIWWNASMMPITRGKFRVSLTTWGAILLRFVAFKVRKKPLESPQQ